jgi:uncharacterized protein YbjT (DUF2867 family)
MSDIVTVFGGTGFLGRRVVQALVAAGAHVRVAARHPDAVNIDDPDGRVEPIAVDVRNDAEVRESVRQATAVVNAVSLYVEKGALTFDAIHVEGAARVAHYAKQARATQLIHISGLGVDAESPSRFVRARAEGEKAVAEQFPGATLVRPSVMCGRGDAFVNSLDRVTRMPVVPLFGKGETLVQPAYVEDVALAVSTLALSDNADRQTQQAIFELGGGEVCSYRQAVEAVMAYRHRKKPLVPVPFFVWRAMVKGMSMMPSPPLTEDQLFLMQTDNVAGNQACTFADLGIKPHSLADVLPECLP